MIVPIWFWFIVQSMGSIKPTLTKTIDNSFVNKVSEYLSPCTAPVEPVNESTEVI